MRVLRKLMYCLVIGLITFFIMFIFLVLIIGVPSLLFSTGHQYLGGLWIVLDLLALAVYVGYLFLEEGSDRNDDD